MQTKFKYPAETTANTTKIPRQMSLFIKQDRITSNLRNVQAIATQGKHHSTIPRKKTQDKFRTIKSKFCNFQTNLNKIASAQYSEKIYKNANLTKF
jgi:hypothetical protein